MTFHQFVWSLRDSGNKDSKPRDVLADRHATLRRNPESRSPNAKPRPSAFGTQKTVALDPKP